MRSLNKVIKSYQYDSVSPPGAGSSAPDGAPQDCRAAEKNPDASPKGTMDRAFEKARQIIDSAQSYSAQAAKESAEKCRQEYEEARQRGYSDGFARGSAEGKKSGEEIGRREGLEKGRKDAEAESGKTLDELALMIETVEKGKTDILQEFEGDLEELAFTMAKAILKRELSLDGNALRSIIVAATDSYRNQAWLRIHVDEKSAGTLLKADGGIAKALMKVSNNVKVVAVPEMDDGSCVIEMPDQVIDAGVDSQLRKMKTAVESIEQNKTG